MDTDDDWSPVSERVGLRPRLTALLMVVALLLVQPLTATAAGEAQPVTLGEWMRIIFVAPERQIDPSQKGVAVALATPPPPVVQTSSEPAPAKEPVVRATPPRFWLPKDRDPPRRWRRRRR
jgi:hypothetical protein